jgi:hypothetical protein
MDIETMVKPIFVFDHHDCIIDDEADGDGQGHQREIVEAVAEHVHHRESADQRQRYGNRGDDRRPKVPQEYENDANDQRDRQKEREFDIGDTGPDCLRAIGYDLDLYRRRNGRLELLQRLLDQVHRLDHIGAGLALDREDDGRGRT